ncbi:MAG: Trm112 family protein [Nitrospira sp.]|nr:Trm112 family protein [Nitrospira sp.]
MTEDGGNRRSAHLDKELLSILCCPETKLDVSLADQVLIDRINEAVGRGTVKNKGKKPVTEPLDGGLVRADRKLLYPIREDIPVMLIEEAIPLDDFA